MNFKQSVGFKDLITLQARLNFTVKVYKTMDSQLLLHVKVNVALLTLKIELFFIVLVCGILVIIPRRFVRKEPCTKGALKWKIVRVF